MPQVQVPFDLDPVPQRYAIQGIEIQGTRAIVLMINSPMCVHGVVFTEEVARKLADDLRAAFGGLTIATEIPKNGQAPA